MPESQGRGLALQHLLSRDLQIFNGADGLRDNQAVFPKPFNMKFDRSTNFIFDFFHRLPGRHATGKIWNVGGIIVFYFFNDGSVAHGLTLLALLA